MSIPETSDPGPLAEVRQGMRVVDTRGDEVGLVDTVRMGDPEAVTDSGESTREVGLLAEAAPSGVSEQAQHHLDRMGYIRIDRSGVFTGTAYAAGDEVARVDGDTVHLTKERDSLLSG